MDPGPGLDDLVHLALPAAAELDVDGVLAPDAAPGPEAEGLDGVHAGAHRDSHTSPVDQERQVVGV